MTRSITSTAILSRLLMLKSSKLLRYCSEINFLARTFIKYRKRLDQLRYIHYRNAFNTFLMLIPTQQHMYWLMNMMKRSSQNKKRQQSEISFRRQQYLRKQPLPFLSKVLRRKGKAINSIAAHHQNTRKPPGKNVGCTFTLCHTPCDSPTESMMWSKTSKTP